MTAVLTKPQTAEAALFERWRKIIEGEEVPAPVRIIPDFEEIIAELEREKKVKFTEKAKWPLRFIEVCQQDHPGERVIYMDTDAGRCIIAAGEYEVGLFHKHFLDAFGWTVHLHYPFDPR